MSYELKKPITETQRVDFIAKYNHCHGLKIEDTEMFLFALEKDEIMGEKEIEIDVTNYDEDGQPIIHKETITIPYPVKNPDFPAIELEKAKTAKYTEALKKAYDFEQNGTVEFKNCVFEMSLSNRNNLDNTQEALEKSGQTQTEWLDKNDELVTLTLEDIQYIRLNLILGRIQKLWIDDYPSYIKEINDAETVEEVEAIEIDYNVE